MGISGMMRTSVLGMHAQANRLSIVADNIANSNTVGYKRSGAQFSTLVLASNRTAYESGGVNTHIRHDISKQGSSYITMRPGDAMINGNGFFRVGDFNGAEYMTRSGSFGRDKNGFLQNTAGYYLLDINGQRIQINGSATDLIPPEATRNISLGINLKAEEEIFSGNFDPENPKTYHQKKSLETYDIQGGVVTLDMYFTKTNNNEWKMVVYRNGTPIYDINGNVDPGSEQVLKFDVNGDLVTPEGKIDLNLPDSEGGTYPVALNFGGNGEKLITQMGSSYAFVLDADGMTTGYYTGFTFSKNGDVEVSYSNGKTISRAIVGMVTVQVLDRLTVLSGTVFQRNSESGPLITGRAGEGVFGELQVNVLERSNADIADELTDMIEAQRNYTANSKVFQAGSELMEIIVNLKR
ncbi:MAG: flagellar hook protein FlgE [Candidatus Tokpelaia sp. JSC189]|nr:MAG: flagellar hook protein FlgE [Candidatus Tokpelaia sp. JSC189]